jgi:metallo-beta-lactamase family protein
MTTQRSEAPTLQFLGAAGTVTGSKYLIRSAAGSQVLIDCGLFQGRKELRLRNWDPLGVDPSEIDAVVVTHAHIDHCGYLPRLVADGFTGTVWCTPGTAHLARIVLPDSGHLQEEEAEFANRKGYSRHHPAVPLYTEEQAVSALTQLRPVEFGLPTEVAAGITVTFRHAGHILGASSVEVHLTDGDRRVLFSGDLGRQNHPLLKAPDPAGPADVVICETTYGDDDRPSEAALVGGVHTALGEIVSATARRGGVVLIPAFAVDRTEIVLHHLETLLMAGEIPDLPIYVDSPMASAALEVYRSEAMRGSSEFRTETHGVKLFPHLNVTETRTVEESKALNSMHGPMVIISASGMATGGRILHHLASRIGDDRNSVVLAGFQAPGTRGSRLAAGETSIKLLGSYRPVVAKVHQISLSAHADRAELTQWLRAVVQHPDRTSTSRTLIYLTHGEPSASAAFAGHLAGIPEITSGSVVVIPSHGEVVRLDL